MATTKLADVIVPEIFNPYVAEAWVKRSAFFNSGVVRNVSTEVKNQSGGSQVEMPFWKPLPDADAVLVDTTDIVPAKHSTAQQSAPVLNRVQSWERSDLSAALSGSDPMQALADQVADAEAAAKQRALLATVIGSITTGTTPPLLLDISGLTAGAAVIDANSFLDAEQKLGDAKPKLTAIAIHSATETALRKQNLIDYIMPSEGALPIPFYNGKRVIIDDELPAASGVYTSFLFAAGSVAYADFSGELPVETESERQALINGGQETLVRRMRYLMHVAGYQWTPGTAPTNGAFGPTNAELQAANWTKVVDTKNVGVVAFKHRVVAA